MMTMRSLPLFVFGALIGLTVTGCSEDKARTVPNPGPGNSTPTMVTTNVDTYVSDSGYVKYHAVTDIWEMYDETDTPFWRFPHPLNIDMFAPGMKLSSHVECDSALYYTQRRLFRFSGNVMAVNVQRDTFLTPELYWDQFNTEFYTDSFIHIVKADRVIEGYGFRSNEKMTKYTINRPTAIIPASALRGSDKPGNEAKRDSIMNEDFDPLGRPAPRPASEAVNNNDFVRPRMTEPEAKLKNKSQKLTPNLKR